MKGYKEYMDNIKTDPALHEKIMTGVQKSRRKLPVFRIAATAAGLAVLLLGMWAILDFMGEEYTPNDTDNGIANATEGPQNENGFAADEPENDTENDPQVPPITIHPLTFNPAFTESSRVMTMPGFSHELTAEQFRAIFPGFAPPEFSTIVYYQLERDNTPCYLTPLTETISLIPPGAAITHTIVLAHDSDGVEFRLAKGEGFIFLPDDEPQISHVHGVEVTATIRDRQMAVYSININSRVIVTSFDFDGTPPYFDIDGIFFGFSDNFEVVPENLSYHDAHIIEMLDEVVNELLEEMFPELIREVVQGYYVRADFMIGDISYRVSYYNVCETTAKDRITARVNEIIASGAPDWSVLADPVIPPLRDERMPLPHARLDPDFGAFMPVNIPVRFNFDVARRTQNQWHNGLFATWNAGLESIRWCVRTPDQHDLSRIVSAADREKFDVSLYSIPWASSVPDDIHHYFQSPVFLAEELSIDIIRARTRPDFTPDNLSNINDLIIDEIANRILPGLPLDNISVTYLPDYIFGNIPDHIFGNISIPDLVEPSSWLTSQFGILYGDVLIEISANGLSPEELYNMLP